MPGFNTVAGPFLDIALEAEIGMMGFRFWNSSNEQSVNQSMTV